MNEACQQAEGFLSAVFDGSGLKLRATSIESDEGCMINIEGPDASFLLNEGGELLDALQHLANQAYGRHLPKGERIVCDVENFRATREAELRAMARHAAGRVRSTGIPFTFGPMTASERRVIHLTLAGSEDLATESTGEGSARRIKVTPKAAK